MTCLTRKHLYAAACLAAVFCMAVPSPARAQPTEIPSNADAGRIGIEKDRLPTPDTAVPAPAVSASLPSVPVPAGAGELRFVLKAVDVKGAAAFPDEQLKGVYSSYLGQEITLETVYNIAAAITARYREAGYFLSLAYVPEQEIEDGAITLQVAEGYVGEVELDASVRRFDVVQRAIDGLVARRPLKSAEMESFLLRMNDLPGYSFKGVLGSMQDGPEGAVRLSLVHAEKDAKGSLGFDNYASRYLGPHEVSASYGGSFASLQQTDLSLLTSLPLKKLNYAGVTHSVPLFPSFFLKLGAGYSRAEPGYTLENFDVETSSKSLNIGFSYQWMRQRDRNLSLELMLDGRNTDSDIVNAPFTRDRVRALRASASFDVFDAWSGYNAATVRLSCGLDALGASERGGLLLSRAQARPDFTKIEASFSRLQSIGSDWSFLFAASGQKASGPLFSSEEFGYGGQSFGRAYDASEITGDHGLAGSLELRFGGWSELSPVALQPYAFYDIGAVWNDDAGEPARETGASAGIGLRGFTKNGFSGNLGVAIPLSRSVETPLYGQNGKNPRFLLQISREF